VLLGCLGWVAGLFFSSSAKREEVIFVGALKPEVYLMDNFYDKLHPKYYSN